MKRYLTLPIIVLVAAAINFYRTDNSLVRAWDTIFGLAPILYFAYHILRRSNEIDSASISTRRALLHGVVVQCVISSGALSVIRLLTR